jgi:hypothetical protein
MAEGQVNRFEQFSTPQTPQTPQAPGEGNRFGQFLTPADAGISKQESAQMEDVVSGYIDMYRKHRKNQQRGGPPFGQIGHKWRSDYEYGMSQASGALKKDYGFTDESIEYAADIRDRMDAPEGTGRTIGGLVMGVGVPIALDRLAPGLGKLAKVGITALGAGVGGMAGEAVQTKIEEDRWIENNEALKAMLIESAWEVGGQGVAGLGKMIFSPLVKKTVPLSADLVDAYTRNGGKLTPAQRDARMSVAFTESMSRGAAFSGELYRAAERGNLDAARLTAKQVVQSITREAMYLPPHEIGEIVMEAFTHGGWIDDVADDLIGPLYDATAAQRAAATIGPRNMRAVVKEELERDLRIHHLPENIRNEFTWVQDKMSTKPVNFQDFIDRRKYLLKQTRNLEATDTVGAEMYKKLTGAMHEDLYDLSSITGMTTTDINMLQEANNLHKALEEAKLKFFPRELVKSLDRAPASVAAKLILDGNPKNIARLRRSLITPLDGARNQEGEKMWRLIKGAWLDDAIETSLKSEKKIQGDAFRKRLTQLGDDGYKELFDSADRQRIESVADLLDAAGKKPMSHTLITMGFQTSAIIGLVGGGLYSHKEGSEWLGTAAGSAAIVISPSLLARMALSPKYEHFLRLGVQQVRIPASTVARTVKLLKSEVEKAEAADEWREQWDATIKSPAFQKKVSNIGQGL